jgi:putative transposase
MRKTILTTGCFYHIYNRGVDKRDIYLNKNDYFRFLISLQEFNQVSRNEYSGSRRRSKKNFAEVRPRQNSDPLVSLVAYCLMPNHFHLLVRQEKDIGISRWMQKVGTGYTIYFNLKNQRSGVLFQGAFKAKRLENDSDLMHLSRYIHLNPEYPLEYLWSSLQFYLNPRKPCLLKIEKDIILALFGSSEKYEKFILGQDDQTALDPFLRIDEE